MSRPYRTALAAVCLMLTFACSSDGGGGTRPALVATFQGVIGGDDGIETGTFLLNFFDNDKGDGTFMVEGGGAKNLSVTLSGGGFIATGGGVNLSGTYDANTITGSYTGGVGGILAGLSKLPGASYTRFCAAHSGSAGDGVYSFIWNQATHDLEGVWTTIGGGFSGTISGQDAQQGGVGAAMSGHTGTVSLFPQLGPPVALAGFYSLSSGENGSVNGTACSSGPAPSIIAVFEGVLGGSNGTENGTVNLNFLSDNTGNGSVTIGGGVAQALGVRINGSTFTATGGGISFSGSFTAGDLDGTYSNNSGGGLVGALKKSAGATFARFCAGHSGTAGNGVYAFVWDPNSHALHGVFTTIGSAFAGIIAGQDGNDAATMGGQSGATILPSLGPPASVGGFFSNISGQGGTMSGGACP